MGTLVQLENPLVNAAVSAKLDRAELSGARILADLSSAPRLPRPAESASSRIHVPHRSQREATPGVDARNLHQVKEFLRQDTAVFPDSVQTIKLMVAEGNLVAAWTTYEGTQQGAMGPFPPSGRKARFDFGAVFRIEGGKIAEWWVTWDNMTILRALGHVPSG